MARVTPLCLSASTALSLLAAPLFPATTAARTIVVDPGGGGDVTTISAGIDAAQDGDVVTVVPGTYDLSGEPISLQGKAITLTSQDGPDTTRLDAGGQPHGITLTQGESSATRISGFTLTGATASAVLIDGASPVLQNLIVLDNAADTADGGAGLRITNGAATLSNCRFEDNRSETQGGAVTVTGGTLSLEDTVFSGNTAGASGGALYLSGLTDAVRMTRVVFTDNSAQQGGALFTTGPVQGTNVVFDANHAAAGGALACDGGTLALTNVTLSGNDATSSGAAIAGRACSATFTNAIFAFNKAATGGVTGGLDADETSTYTFLYSDFFRNGPDPFSTFPRPEDDDILDLDPGFQHYIDDLSSRDDDLHLFPGSPLIDAGHPNEAFNDADGSRADLGAYGGPHADTDYATDTDGDNLPDTWERRHGLDPTENDAVYDLDGDGVINLYEYQYGLLPESPDTDGDGLTDQDEISAISDPRDAFDPETTLTIPNDSLTTIQAAIDAARDGVAIEVLPGTYAEALDFLGKNIHLHSLGGAGATRLSGEDTYPVITLRFGETTDTTIEGFTIAAGASWDNGGAMVITSSGVTLHDIEFRENWAVGAGGALWVHQGTVIGDRTVFEDNGSSDAGGAIAVQEATLILDDATFSGNYGVYDGGAIAATSSVVSLTATSFQNNTSSADGGSLAMQDTQTSLVDITIEGSQATGDGGAIQVDGGRLTGRRLTVLSAASSSSGGAMSATGHAVVQVENLVVNGATAYDGGAIALEEEATASLIHATLVGCYAGDAGGAIFLSGTSITLNHTIVAYNLAVDGGGIAGETVPYTDDDGETAERVPTVDATYTDVYGNRRGDYATVDRVEGAGNLAVDPRFVHYVDDGQPGGDDLHLRPDSPLVDAGDPDADPDPDGSTADLGAFGGPNADFSYYADEDGDGMADGFEVSAGLDPTQDDGADDPDGDGLTNAEEAQLTSSPFSPDTDGDGLTDAEEAASGSDPTDAFSPSGEASVPGTFATIQEAIDAAAPGATITVEPGTYAENLWFLGKAVTLAGRGAPEDTVIDGRRLGAVILMNLGEPPETRVANLTVANGASGSGAGIYLRSASPVLENLILRDNDATFSGGGLASQEGSPTLIDIRAYNNATGSRGQGGGLYFLYGAPTVTRAIITGNTASSGAGIYLTNTSATLENVLTAGNEATYGGGISIRFAETPVLVNVTSHSNTAAGGAGLFVEASTVLAVNTVLTGNRAPVGSGILVRDDSSQVTLTYCDVWGNYGENYGGDVLADQTGVNDNLSVDPRYEAFSADGDWSNDDLHLRPDSPLRHAGDPSLKNPDGTASDMGNYGGPNADRSYYQDQDADGMYDGWETLSGLDPTRNDAGDDPDDDGLTNVAEFDHGTDPQSADSDRDGLPDQEELDQGSDPTDFFSPNDTVVVNDAFDSIQDALNAARDGVTLLLEEGLYQERIDFGGKDVVLRGIGAPEKTIIDGGGVGPVVSFRYGESESARLERVTIRNGSAPDGGGVRIVQSHPTFDRVIVRDNTAQHSGGGLSIINAWPTFYNCLITGNAADEGGGVGARQSLPTLVGVTIAGNSATGAGGGFSCVDLCSPTILNTVVAFNDADDGGGIHIVAPQLVTFQNNDVYGNSLDDYSGTYADQTGKNGNISEDPRFTAWPADGTSADFHPQPDSPLIDTGKDVTRTEVPWDLDGIPRPADGDWDGEAQFDMGAYELEVDVDFDGYLPSQGDCDEGDPATYPGAGERCDDGVDQDCDGEDLPCAQVDQDGDGFSEAQGDCDDSDAAVSPGADEVENGVDDDCDGDIDEGFASPTPVSTEDAGGCSCRTGAPAQSPPIVPAGGGLFMLVLAGRWRSARHHPVVPGHGGPEGDGAGPEESCPPKWRSWAARYRTGSNTNRVPSCTESRTPL